jgi:hypothetical protein
LTFKTVSDSVARRLFGAGEEKVETLELSL